MLPALLVTLSLTATPISTAAAPAEQRAAVRASHSTASRGARARASSTAGSSVGGARHDAALLLDGNPRTAWCEGAPGVGIGEWVEVRPHCPRGKGVCKVAIENGWSRSPETWAQHGRVTRLRISSCNLSGDVTTVDLKDVGDRQEFVLRPPLPAPACVRLTILGATSGQDQNTCLSEVIASCECED